MRFVGFDWDGSNTEHIARHALEPFEVEAALRGGALVLRGRGGRYLAYGRTAAGRYLVIVLHAHGGGIARVVTARDMTERERRFYHRRH